MSVHLSRLTIPAWLALIVPWVCAPFVGGDMPDWMQTTYFGLCVLIGAFGLAVACASRRWALGVASVVSAAAWPIVLLLVLRFAAFN